MTMRINGFIGRSGKTKAVIIVEKILGKELPFGAEVHHVDGDPTNDDRSNLVVCQDKKYHRLLHQRTDALEACGHADWRFCRYCRKYDSLDNLRKERNHRYYHKKCKARSEMYRRKSTQKRMKAINDFLVGIKAQKG